MRTYSISLLKEEWKKYRGHSLDYLMVNYVFPRKDIYDVQVVDDIPADIHSPLELIEEIVRPWAERKLFRTINGIILEINEDGVSTARYLEEKSSAILPDYYIAPDDIIGSGSVGFHIPGHPNETWNTIECLNLDGNQVFLLDNNDSPSVHDYLVVNGKCQVIMQTMIPGFSDLLISQIREKLSEMQNKTTQTIAMANGYNCIRDGGKQEKEHMKLPDNYSTLSLREKIEINKAMRSQSG